MADPRDPQAPGAAEAEAPAPASAAAPALTEELRPVAASVFGEALPLAER